jgi:hypothetical protein
MADARQEHQPTTAIVLDATVKMLQLALLVGLRIAIWMAVAVAVLSAVAHAHAAVVSSADA